MIKKYHAAALRSLTVAFLLPPLWIAAAEETTHSPYAGQERRAIKALSPADVEGLQKGEGTPFGGMAKPAELNGYPGPRHVLDAFEAGQLELTNEQQQKIESLYNTMRDEAVALGAQLIAIEKEIDNAFTDKTINESALQAKVKASADLYGQLRIAHLKHHLAMVEILTEQQVAAYNQLRGYTNGNPCDNIPEGHNPFLWKLHNNCP